MNNNFTLRNVCARICFKERNIIPTTDKKMTKCQETTPLLLRVTGPNSRTNGEARDEANNCAEANSTFWNTVMNTLQNLLGSGISFRLYAIFSWGILALPWCTSGTLNVFFIWFCEALSWRAYLLICFKIVDYCWCFHWFLKKSFSECITVFTNLSLPSPPPAHFSRVTRTPPFQSWYLYHLQMSLPCLV